jgi:hypothetical protein
LPFSGFLRLDRNGPEAEDQMTKQKMPRISPGFKGRELDHD